MELDASARLVAIERSGILAMARSKMLHQICEQVCRELAVDDAQVNIITKDRQVFVAEYPKPRRKRQPNPLTNSGCREVVLADSPVVIPDSREHPIMCAMPWVKDWLGYLGCPIRYDGLPIGSLCVLTRAVREWTDADVALVQKYADRISLSL